MTPPTRRPVGEEWREEGERRGRTVKEGVGCQEEAIQGSDYSGTANTTTGGLTCQAWSVQEPHEHGYSHYGDHNYCRNLDGNAGGVWCYTTDPDTRFEECPVTLCLKQTVKVLDFSMDVDQGTDSNTRSSATMEKEDLPPSFTICTAYKVEAWTTELSAANMFILKDDDGYWWGYVLLYAASDSTYYEVYLGPTTLVATTSTLYFPLQWTRVCVSLDSDSAMVRLVVDGQMLGQKEYKVEEDLYKPTNLAILLVYPGLVSSLNMFFSALSLERMVGLTTAGGEECGALGDYLSWEEVEWTLNSAARMLELNPSEGACIESKVQVFTAVFKYHDDCMEHCQKIGHGRSPPVGTLQQWETFTREVDAITPDTSIFLFMCLAAKEGTEGDMERLPHWPETIEVNETVWRDYYTGERMEEFARPWFSNHDAWLGDEFNCLGLDTRQPWEMSWNEFHCNSYEMTCPCQYQQQPILRLRGLCSGSGLETFDKFLGTLYTPVQLPGDPANMLLVGGVNTRIEYDKINRQWTMTDARFSVTATSRASKLSYVLGKHKWNITNDVYECHEGQPYTAQLKLTGCDQEGEFTCDDGQCVRMEQRCDQVVQCRDKSDEVNCQILALESSYNKRVPPITTVSATNFTVVPVPVNVSLLLMKVVEIEEVDHSIHFQFQINLEWKEMRATYLNIKSDTSLNTLTDDDISQLWLPLVIYGNTDQKETTRLGSPWEWRTIVTVNREGEFTRSSLEEVDEAEIFKGGENRLTMYQTYTHEFQCVYQLTRYPFDTQVTYSWNMMTIHPTLDMQNRDDIGYYGS